MGTFTEPDSHSIIYGTPTQSDLTALPAWVTFNENTGVFYGYTSTAAVTTVRIYA